MKNNIIDAKSLIAKYKDDYLIDGHLKKKYRNFVEDLLEYDF
jgi:hypothetical protein